MKNSEAMGELFAALSLAQSEIRGAAKDHVNPHFKSRYADLASVWDACRDALVKHKFCVLQPTSADGAKVTVTTLLGHASGQWVAGDLTVTAKDASPQSVGSAITYARRYGLASMVGVAPDDDDGEAAQPRRAAAEAPRRNGPGLLPAPATPPPKANGHAPFDVNAADAWLVRQRLAATGDLVAALEKKFGPALAEQPEAALKGACREFTEGRKARAARLESIAELCHVKHADWAAVCRLAGVRKGVGLDQLSDAEVATALAFLEGMPDVDGGDEAPEEGNEG